MRKTGKSRIFPGDRIAKWNYLLAFCWAFIFGKLSWAFVGIPFVIEFYDLLGVPKWKFLWKVDHNKSIILEFIFPIQLTQCLHNSRLNNLSLLSDVLYNHLSILEFRKRSNLERVSLWWFFRMIYFCFSASVCSIFFSWRFIIILGKFQGYWGNNQFEWKVLLLCIYCNGI